jgi:hypothetical protein
MSLDAGSVDPEPHRRRVGLAKRSGAQKRQPPRKPMSICAVRED